MKKYLVLLLIALIALCFSAPLFASAEAADDPPAPDAPVVEAVQETPIVQTATEVAQEAEPGGPLIDLTVLIQGILTVILGWLARYVVPFLKTKLNDWQFDALYRTTAFIVESAEQQFGPGKGRDKLEYTTKRLMEQGYAVNLDMIEAIVRGLRENLKPTTTI